MIEYKLETRKITIPFDAYDIKLGTDTMTSGILFKIPDLQLGWRGIFISFHSFAYGISFIRNSLTEVEVCLKRYA